MRISDNKFRLANAALVAALTLALSGCGDELESEQAAVVETPADSGSNTDNSNDTPNDQGDAETGSDLVVFTDAENDFWPAWDCCGGTTPTTPVETDDHGLVTEFSLGALPAVLGFTRSESQGPLDISAYEANGSLQFDLKVTQAPTDGDTNWFFKLESNGGIQNGGSGEEVEIQIDTPELNSWQTVSVSLADLANQGLDLSSIDNILIYPQWDTGNGAIYRVDNVEFVTGGSAGEDNSGDSNTGTAELVSNGDFENGATGWSGNAANAVDDGGNSVNYANVAEAGNPWDVNLSNELALIAGETYELTFRARSPQARSIIAGIGENHDPWGSATETVQLTTEWASYTLTLTAEGFGDDNSRILFDMGGEAGEVYLDDVSLVVISDADDSDADAGATELLANGDFENGADSWAGNAANAVDDGGNAVNYANVAEAGNPWDVNLNQVLALTPGETYQMTFRARSPQARSIIAGIGEDHDPWGSATESVQLTTEWATYTLTLTAEGFGDENCRVLFDMGRRGR